MIAPRSLFRDADGRIVEAGDPAAAFLVANTGCIIEPEWRAAAAEHLGVAVEAEPEPADRTVTFGTPTEPEPEPQAEDESADAPVPEPEPTAKRARKPKS